MSERVVVCDVGPIPADCTALDVLARLCLATERVGCELRLRNASSALRGLIEFAGFGDVLPCGPDSGLEIGRQSELGEDAVDVEEEADPDDPVARDLEHLERPRLEPVVVARFVLRERGRAVRLDGQEA